MSWTFKSPFLKVWLALTVLLVYSTTVTSASLATLYPLGPGGLSMLNTHCWSFSFLASSFSSPSSFCESLKNTTKLPMAASLFLTVASSIFLISLVRAGLVWRAKIIATGFSPFLQNRQNFSPAFSPLQLSGWNGPGTALPTCGPDFNSPAHTPTVNSRAVTHTATVPRYLVMRNLLV